MYFYGLHGLHGQETTHPGCLMPNFPGFEPWSVAGAFVTGMAPNSVGGSQTCISVLVPPSALLSRADISRVVVGFVEFLSKQQSGFRPNHWV